MSWKMRGCRAIVLFFLPFDRMDERNKRNGQTLPSGLPSFLGLYKQKFSGCQPMEVSFTSNISKTKTQFTVVYKLANKPELAGCGGQTHTTKR